jgi:hypothetical protein
MNTSDDEDAIVQTFRTTNCSPECDNCEHSLCVNTVDPDENPNKTFNIECRLGMVAKSQERQDERGGRKNEQT